MLTVEEFENQLRMTSPELYNSFTELRSGGSVSPAGLPKGIEQLADGVEKFMPILEKISGRSRSQLTTDFIKAAARGKIEDFFKGFISGVDGSSSPEEKPSKREKLIYLLSVRVPLFFFLLGLAALVLFALYRYILVIL